MNKNIFLILSYVSIGLLFLQPKAHSSQTVHWGYKNISQHSGCSDESLENSYAEHDPTYKIDEDELNPDGCDWPLTGVDENNDGSIDYCIEAGSCRAKGNSKFCLRYFSKQWWQSSNLKNALRKPCGYLSITRPTFRFNIDTTSDISQVYFNFKMGTSSDLSNADNVVIDFTSPAYDVISEGTESKTWFSRDVEFTVGQAEGTYLKGSPEMSLGAFGTSTSYYWAFQGCNANGSCSEWLTSGNPSQINNDITDCSLAFILDKHFAANSDIKEYSQVGAITQNEATVKFISPYNLEYFIEVDTNSTFFSPIIFPLEKSLSGTPTTFTLTNLEANTTYYYRLKFKEQGDPGAFETGITKSFNTAKTRGTTFSFGLTADMHKSAAKGLNNLLVKYSTFFYDNDADFWISLGDFWTNEHAQAVTQDMYNYMALDLFEKTNSSLVPLIRVMGNHENNSFRHNKNDWGWPYEPLIFNDTVNFAGQALADLFPIYDHDIGGILAASNKPDHKTFFSFEWGDATFVILDPYTYNDQWPVSGEESFTLGDEQTEWFRNILKTHSTKWLLVFMHQTGAGQEDPFWTYKDFARFYGRGGVQSLSVSKSAAIEPLLDDMSKVDNIVVFTGHDHVMSYEKYSGIHFIAVGSLFQSNWPYLFLGYTADSIRYNYEQEWHATIDSINCKNSSCTLTYSDECSGTPTSSEEALNPDCSSKNLVNYIRFLKHTKPGKTEYHVNIINETKKDEARLVVNSWSPSSMTLRAASVHGFKGFDGQTGLVDWEAGDIIRFLPVLNGFSITTVSPDKLEYQIYKPDKTIPTNTFDMINKKESHYKITISYKKPGYLKRFWRWLLKENK